VKSTIFFADSTFDLILRTVKPERKNQLSHASDVIDGFAPVLLRSSKVNCRLVIVTGYAFLACWYERGPSLTGGSLLLTPLKGSRSWYCSRKETISLRNA